MSSALGGGLLIRANRVLPLTGLPGHPWLRPGSALLAVVARWVADGAQHAVFPCPDPRGRRQRRQGAAAVTVLGCGDEQPHFLRASLDRERSGRARWAPRRWYAVHERIGFLPPAS